MDFPEHSLDVLTLYLLVAVLISGPCISFASSTLRGGCLGLPSLGEFVAAFLVPLSNLTMLVVD